MTQFAISQELKFREEATRRSLEELYELKDWDLLMDTALLLNQLWHQQSAIAKWFAHEAAENLSEAWAMSAKRD